MHIRFYGHLRAGFGLAGGARATARCLKAAGCQLSYIDLALASHAPVQALPTEQSGASTAPSQVDLVHTNPNILASNPELLERHPLKAPLRIGFGPGSWSVPHRLGAVFQGYHEIWCPSSFTAQALAQRSPIPVIAPPHLPDWPHLQARATARQEAALPDVRPTSAPLHVPHPVRFLEHARTQKPGGVLRAFQKAFPRQDRSGPTVQLLVKASSAEQFPEQAAALKRLSQGDPRIR